MGGGAAANIKWYGLRLGSVKMGALLKRCIMWLRQLIGDPGRRAFRRRG